MINLALPRRAHIHVDLAAACVVGSAKDLAAARVDSWNVSDFSMNLSIDSIRNLASVSGYCVPHSPTFLSPFGINMRISEAEQDSEILEEELFKAGAVGASNTQALPTVTEVSEDKTGVETYGETRVPGIGDASDFLRDVTVDMPHNELQEVGAVSVTCEVQPNPGRVMRQACIGILFEKLYSRNFLIRSVVFRRGRRRIRKGRRRRRRKVFLQLRPKFSAGDGFWWQGSCLLWRC